MLESLSINNIALIDSCTIEFGKGLNILSGETGAGKSIILDALTFIMGGRADRTLIRHGESVARVKAIFNISLCNRVKDALSDMGIEDEDELIILREMTLDGKNTCRVNGEKVTLSMLRTVTAGLVDIYGQHDNNRLLMESEHIRILDDYIGKPLIPLKDEVAAHYSKVNELRKKIDRIGTEKDINKKLDLLEYQINEIKEAALTSGEEEELIKLSNKYGNVEDILNGLNSSYSLLQGEYNDNNVVNAVSEVVSSLGKISEYDEEISELYSRLEELKIELVDVARTVERLAEGIEYDPVDARRVDERIALIKSLKRKYGDTVDEILQNYNDMLKEYDEYSDMENTLDKLHKEYSDEMKLLIEASRRLSGKRKEYAVKFEKQIIDELEVLGMKGSVFVVDFVGDGDDEVLNNRLSPNGYDDIRFLISANVGQEPRALNKIISGGELSRFMLAMKNIIAKTDSIDTMVFDEIDTGISGYIADVVAKKLYAISKDRQVLAVTHLPQLGSMADCHYLISKSVVDGKTVTHVELLDKEHRIMEIIRLTGGNKNSDIAIAHATEMYDMAEKYKMTV